MYIHNIYVHKDVVYITYISTVVIMYMYNNNIVVLYLYAAFTVKILNADSIINITF